MSPRSFISPLTSPRRALFCFGLSALFAAPLSHLHAQTPTTAQSTAGSQTPATSQSTAQTRVVTIEVDGQPVEVSPAPVITRTGSVLVPLRGVLEKLGAKIEYVAKEKRIDVRQGGKLYILRVGQKSAVADAKLIPLTAAPQAIEGVTYVPLRSLVELFGYRIEWDNAAKTVLIDTQALATNFANHRAALQAAGAIGVTVDFTVATPADVPILLDAAKRSGVGFIQTRFDWGVVQPVKGAPFDWSIYDAVVRAARARNLVLVGILGNSAKWASISSKSQIPAEWRFAAPKPNELPSFETYVQRTVERYRRDVHAWQVWDNPASYKFRAASALQYRNVVKLAVAAARRSDPKAIVHAAEPGGLNLSFVRAMQRDGIANLVDGLNVYPLSQWQPGVEAATSELARPFAALGGPISVGRSRWVGGLSHPIFNDGTAFNNASEATRERLKSTYTPQAQADYAVRSTALALALGAEKVIWDRLRDDAEYESVQPVNPEVGSGLLARNGTPRPSYAAWQTTSRLMRDKKYLGALATGPDVIALVFDNGKEGSVVAWSPNGRGKIVYNATGDPQVPNATYIEVREGAIALDASGNPLPEAPGTIELGRRTIWLSSVSAATALRAKTQGQSGPLRLRDGSAPLPSETTQVRVTFGDGGVEQGLAWRKYDLFRGQARKISSIEGQSGLTTQVPLDIFRPSDGRPFIFLDVDDDFLFATPGVPVVVTVRVGRVRASTSDVTNSAAGFDIEYNSPFGARTAPWQVVEAGTGWVDYSFQLPDASFGNVNGYDLRINTFGSKQDLVFGEIKVTRR